MEFLFSVLGVVFIIEGIPYFAFPDKVKSWAEALGEIENNMLRYLGVASMVVGLLLVYVATKYL